MKYFPMVMIINVLRPKFLQIPVLCPKSLDLPLPNDYHLFICLWKSRSLVNKVHDFQSFIYSSSFNVVAIVETSLSPIITNNGYSPFIAFSSASVTLRSGSYYCTNWIIGYCCYLMMSTTQNYLITWALL